ncbi:MAG: DUF5010 domain-containing protein [Armatimonadota bacterium]
MVKPAALCGAAASLLAAFAASAQSSWFQEPPAPGPHAALAAEDLAAVESFPADARIIGTYLFYWYDVYSGAHVTYADGGDACTTHPSTWDDYSHLSPRWWRQQLTDIVAAGIDFAAPVYWGYPEAYDSWSFAGLPPLVEACDALRAAGEPCPKIALFYDTSTLRHNATDRHIDLSTADGKAWFYCSIRDFFSLIPPRHWAAIEGRPIVLLYSPSFAAAQDPALFPYVRERFRHDFGVEPWIIKQSGWQGEADSTCEWGGALGLRLAGCAALGPGYDHSAVRGRQPLVVPREDGAFYAANWEKLLRLSPERRPHLVMVETWNEFHEGTDVAESREYGRQYIELTREYANRFHRGERLPPSGPYAGAQAVTWSAAQGDDGSGLRIRAGGDGLFTHTELAGKPCVQSAPSEHAGRYLYFDVHESFAFDIDPTPMRVVVQYCDVGCDSFGLEYDSHDPAGSVRDGAFKPAGRVQIAGSGTWRSISFDLADARFADRSNGADLRLAVSGAGELGVAAVRVERLEAP